MISSVLTGQQFKDNMKTPLQIDNFLLEIIAKQSELEGKKDLFPHKNLRTYTMLLDMEDRFISPHQHQSSIDLQRYLYYLKVQKV